MKYYQVTINGVLTTQLKTLLDVAVRTGDIIEGYTIGYNTIYFAAHDNNQIEGKLIRNGYEVSIG